MIALFFIVMMILWVLFMIFPMNECSMVIACILLLWTIGTFAYYHNEQTKTQHKIQVLEIKLAYLEGAI